MYYVYLDMINILFTKEVVRHIRPAAPAWAPVGPAWMLGGGCRKDHHWSPPQVTSRAIRL